MKITWKGTNYGQVGFHTEPQEYDAIPPVESLLLDHAPASINPEREAVAAYLAFGHWTSGDLQLPHRLGPNTATAIEQDMSRVAVRPGPIEYYPKPLELGTREVLVGFDISYARNDIPAIAVLPVAEWTGSVRSLQSITVASNAFALDVAASGAYGSIRARLAVAVLFAGDLSADTLLIDDAQLPDTEKKRIEELLLAVRLGVKWRVVANIEAHV